MSKKLVTYFTASGAGNTKAVAEKLADAIGAEVFEITPIKPYTADDIKWTNPLSRCNKEKFGKKDVPVSGLVDNFAEYDEVFIGFPIWYGIAPNVVHTFCDGYEWSGKRIAVFATSGGSGMGKSGEKILEHTKGSPELVGAKLFTPGADAEELKAWAEGL